MPEESKVNDHLRPIAEAPRYWIRSDGTVFKTVRGGLKRLKPAAGPYGYPRIRLHFSFRTVWRRIHQLVLTTFVGPRPSQAHQARHLDGNKWNNALSNLAWGTAAENMTDSIRLGQIATGDRNGARTRPDRLPRGEHHGLRKDPSRAAKGSANGAAKLSESAVASIREARASGRTYSSIASDFGVTESCVALIATRKTWRHVP